MIRRFAAGLASLALLLPATAQIPGQGGGANAALARLYADAPPFSADCTMTVTPTNRAGMRPVTVPMKFLVRDGRLRLDLDLSRVQGADIPADQLRSLRQLGMIRMNTVVFADARRMLISYPDLKASAYLELPPGAMPDPATLRLEARPDGEERLGGEAATRERITLTEPDGTPLTGTLWRSPRQSNLPVKVALNDADGVVTIELKGLRLQPPPGPEEFGIPAGFREFPSLEALTQEAMRRTEKR
ncbi:MAG TPA: hypothetical protein PKE47_10290 [Verrucomicrobiota bacterium]|nr:hypothetical protein [Verrucomicrobiota bacterium]